MQHLLLPVPARVEFKQGRFALNESLRFKMKGYVDARLQTYAQRAARRFESRMGSCSAFGRSANVSNSPVVIHCNGPGQIPPSIDEDESYRLEVKTEEIVLVSPTVVGALRGLETLLQSIETDRNGFFVRAASIYDKPRFPWRGVLIDVSRHWQPVEVIKRNLDGMAAVKLNVLHWHLTDDQGFRIESRIYRKLHEMGSDGLYYTQDQVREIIAYAFERGVRVIPEFDMPGHVTSWLVGYPELASVRDAYQIERTFGRKDPALDPTREEVYDFLDNFLGEMATLFPDAYVHIGGDENSGKHWDSSPHVQAFMKQRKLRDNHALQGFFNQRLVTILAKHGKRMIGWDEVVDVDLPADVLVQSWRGRDTLAESPKTRNKYILSWGYYLNLMYSAAEHYQIDPCPGDDDLDELKTQGVLGGEACMWGESVNSETIDSRLWPRLAAIAERLWSPRTIKDVADLYRRLAVMTVRLEELGLTHETQVDRMLRNLAGGTEIQTLKTLINLVEPTKIYHRSDLSEPARLIPLTRLEDIARPDSATAREFAALVESFLSDAPAAPALGQKLRQIFVEWRRACPTITAILSQHPVWRDAEPIVNELSELATIGLDALEYLTAGIAPAPSWRDLTLSRLEQVAKPKAGVTFAVAPALNPLVIAAANIHQGRRL